MKYRYKLTNLLVVVSLVPMTVLALYSHSRMSSLVRKNEMEDMYSKDEILMMYLNTIHFGADQRKH